VTVAVTVCGSGGFAPPLTAAVPLPPGAASFQVPVTNVAGDWMVAILTWRQTAGGEGITVAAGDDVHNFWEPLGAPTANSSPNGVTVCSLWYAPAAKAASFVTIAPSGVDAAICATILDVSGMSKYFTLVAVHTARQNAGTSLAALTLSAPASQMIAVTGCGTDLNTSTISLAGSGWTTLPNVTASNGTDHTSDLQLSSAYQVTSGSVSATWSSTATLDLSGVIGGILVTTAQPAQPNPEWPIFVAEVAPGFGPTSHPDQMTWVPATARSLALGVTQGRPYLPGTLQAGEGTVTFDNPDLAMTPPGSGSFAGIDSGCPFRIRTIWPASSTPYGVPFSGYLLTYPQQFDAQLLRGSIEAKVTDAWGYANASLQPVLQQEILNEGALYAYWPCTDAPGATQAANVAPGNPVPLQVVRSKYGAGTATEAFGGNTSAILGAQGTLILTSSVRSQSQSGMWGQTVTSSTAYNQGYGLQALDPGYPSISGAGVTLEGFFQITGTASVAALGQLLTITGTNQKQIISFFTGPGSGGGITMTYNTLAGGGANVGVATPGPGVLFHLAVQLTTTTYKVFINGAAVVSGSFSAQIAPSFTYLMASMLGTPDAGNPGASIAGGAYSGFTGHLAVTAGLLHPLRILTHAQAGITAMAGDTAPGRIERLLQAAASLGRRVILQDTGDGITQTASCQDIAGQPAAGSIANIAANTPPGILAVSPPGEIFYLARSYAYNQAARWVLGDNTAGGELPFTLGGFGTDYDPQRVVNDIQLTQLDNLDVVTPSGAAAALEAPSQGQYGDQTYQVTGYLLNDIGEPFTAGPSLLDLANWLAATYATPRTRIAAVVVDAARYPAAWPFVTQAASGDMITLNLRPPTAAAGALITVTGRIAQTTRSLKFAQDGVEGSLGVIIDIAPEQDALTCDDAVRGLLNGTDVLAW
jgi:hypothetical protein